MANEFLIKIKNIICEALTTSIFTSRDIHKVLFAGGSCRMPMIKSLLHEMFSSSEHCCDQNPDEIVAIGAAYYAYYLGLQQQNLCSQSNNTHNNLSASNNSQKNELFQNPGSSSSSSNFFVKKKASASSKVHRNDKNVSQVVQLKSSNKNLHIFSPIWIPYKVERSLIRYDLPMRTISSIHEMILLFSTKVRDLHKNFIVPCLLFSNDIIKIVDPRIQIPMDTSCSPLVLIEVPNENVKSPKADYIAAICTFAAGYDFNSKRHGYPFVVVLHRKWHYIRIFQEILHRGFDKINSHNVGLNIHRENSIIVVGDGNEGGVLDSDLSFPLLNCNMITYCDNRMPLLLLTIKFNATYAESFFKFPSEEAVDQPIDNVK